MFSVYNGMVVGFFNGDWGVLFIVLVSNNKNDIFVILSIVMLDNKFVFFNVGQDVLVLFGLQIILGDNVFNIVECKMVGIKFKVILQVNEGDVVLFEIEQEVFSVDFFFNLMFGLMFNICII